MRKRKSFLLFLYFIAFTITLSLCAIIIIPFAYWHTLPQTPLNIWVIDKTVSDFTYREHNGFIWVLNHMKISNEKNNSPFNAKVDYFGFFPISDNKYEIKDIPKDISYPDLIYVTDTYGVYSDDYLKKNIQGTRSDLIYGGLNEQELQSIKSNLKDKNTVIAEFNTSSHPTSSAVKDEMVEMFGVKWTGWNGRYYLDLSKNIEVPIWAVENYEAQTNKKWEFYGKGFVLVNEYTDQVVVLEKGKHIGKNNMQINFSQQYADEFDTNTIIPYYYWFECISSDNSEVIANYSLDVTDEGQKILDEIGVKNSFPAIIRNKTIDYNSYYFAGDYADLINGSRLYNFYGYAKFKHFTTLNSEGNSDYFYWKCYVPMVTKIMNDVKNTKECANE